MLGESEIPNLEFELFACLQCGYCTSACPAYEQFGWESNTPRGKLFQMRKSSEMSPFEFFLPSKFKLGERFFERLYHCTSCGACNEVCHVNIELSKLWELIKERMVKEGFKPLEQHSAIYKRIADPKKRNPFHDDKDPQRDLLERRTAWLPPDIKLIEPPDVIFFAGCTASYRLQMLSQASVRLLSKANVRFSILGKDEWCCGSPLLRTGQTDIIKNEYALHNVNEIERRGANTVVTACAGCYNTLKGDYPNIVGKLPFKLYHIAEYLELLLKTKKIQFTKPFNKKVSYHDPCHLGRHRRVFEPPRNVIKSIPGIQFIEMARTRERARCCGAGGGFKAAFNDLAENIAADRVREAKGCGAELIITSCPFCVINLNAGAKKANVDIKTMDIVQLAMQVV